MRYQKSVLHRITEVPLDSSSTTSQSPVRYLRHAYKQGIRPSNSINTRNHVQWSPHPTVNVLAVFTDAICPCPSVIAIAVTQSGSRGQEPRPSCLVTVNIFLHYNFTVNTNNCLGIHSTQLNVQLILALTQLFKGSCWVCHIREVIEGKQAVSNLMCHKQKRNCMY